MFPNAEACAGNSAPTSNTCRVCIRPKNVMHDQHLTIVQRPDPDASFVREANESDQFNARVRSSFPSR